MTGPPLIMHPDGESRRGPELPDCFDEVPAKADKG
jgi:hypothetical protein